MRRLVGAVVFILAMTAYGQQHPNDARGFAPDKLYDFHDLDTINSFNGNLSIRIPIGPIFHANALISYQFVLVYNSHCWAYLDNGDGTFTAEPLRTSNAGLGWSFSLGRLISPLDPANSNSPAWVYESADGGQHAFYGGDPVGYTRDSTHLRMRKINDMERRIDFPDGTTRVFQLLKPTADLQPWAPSTASNAVWRLAQITSAKANSVSITHTASTQFNEIWTVADGDRTSWVYFVPTGISTMDSVLDHVDLPAFGGGIATYTFTTTPMTVLPTPGGASPPTVGIGGEAVVLLESVSLPADSSGSSPVYSMMSAGTPAYDGYGAPSGSQSNVSGVLHRLTLPTQGLLHWDYAVLSFSPPGNAKSPAIDQPVAVTQRQTFQPGATSADGTWQYGRKFGNFSCTISNHLYTFHRQLTTWVMRPRTTNPSNSQQDPQYASIAYFSVYDPDSDQCINSESWQGSEYGLPFTRYATRSSTDNDPVTSRYLSSQLAKDFAPALSWDGHGSVSNATNGTAPSIISSTYLTYELDNDLANDRDQNPRVNSAATAYDADAGCSGSTCYTGANSFKYDGFGNYRQISAVSNFSGDDRLRTDWTNLVAANLDGSSPWVAGIWDKRCSVRDSTPRPEIEPSNPTPNPCTTFELTSHARFDANTGLLLAQRTLAASGDTVNGNDVLAAYEYDSEGYALKEKYSGGDTQVLNDPDEFMPPASPTYEIDYTTSYSTAGSMLSRSGAYAIDGLSVLNETYNTNTGVVTKSIDPSGVTTTYSYDARNRLTRISTTGSADTTYAYTDASFGTAFSPASLSLSRQSGADSTSAGLIQQQYDYDAFGRLWHERRLLPSGTAVRETKYTATGLRQQVSEFETTPTDYTVLSGFDPFDRPTVVTAPDTTKTTFDYSGMRQLKRHSFIATISNSSPTDQATTEIYDARHRLYQVSEAADTIQTTYGYDTGGHLSAVTITGNGATQTRSFNYDRRGLLLAEQHPENGTITYDNPNAAGYDAWGYDARGHVGSKTVPDPNGDCNAQAQRCFNLRYQYDHAERLSKVWSLNPLDTANYRILKEFTYSNGKLQASIRHNYQPNIGGDVTVTETYNYDSAGRLNDKLTHIGPVSSIDKTLDQSYSYNDLGLLSLITYPTCYGVIGCGATTWGSIAPQYTNGFLTTVTHPSNATTPDFASGISYWPSGMVNSISHSNGVNDTYAIANGMPRPASITFSNWTSCTPPSIGTQPAGGTIYYNDSKTLSVVASGDNLTYQWYAGQTPLSGATSPSVTVTPSQTTTYFVRIVNGCGRADSSTATVTVQLRAPTTLIADRSGTNSITVTWHGSTGASYYELWRRSGASWVSLGTKTGLSFMDSVASSATFFYHVTASGSNVTTSAPSNNDLESTLSFTSVTSDLTIYYSHFSELRDGVNSVRAAWGDPALSWADILNVSVNNCAYGTVGVIPAPNADIYAAHVMRLRCAMDNALARAGIASRGYTDPDLTNLTIRAIHVIELQQQTDYLGDGR